MKVKDNQVQIVISRKTIVKIVAVSYLTFGFLKAIDAVLVKHVNPGIDRLIDRTVDRAENELWAEAVKEQ